MRVNIKVFDYVENQRQQTKKKVYKNLKGRLKAKYESAKQAKQSAKQVKNSLQNTFSRNKTGAQPTNRPSARNVVGGFVSGAGRVSDGVGSVDTAVGLIDIVAGLAKVCTGAFGTTTGIVLGPLTGGVGTLVGFGIGQAVAIKNEITDFEKAHEKLMPYVHSYLNSSRAPQAVDEVAIKYAMRLIQNANMEDPLKKVENATRDFVIFQGKYDAICKQISNASNIDTLMVQLDQRQELIVNALMGGASTKGGKGGAIFKLCRRYAHYGNYLQAFAVCGKAFSGTTGVIAPPSNLKQVRKIFEDIEKRINSDEEVIERWAQSNGIRL